MFVLSKFQTNSQRSRDRDLIDGNNPTTRLRLRRELSRTLAERPVRSLGESFEMRANLYTYLFGLALISNLYPSRSNKAIHKVDRIGDAIFSTDLLT